MMTRALIVAGIVIALGSHLPLAAAQSPSEVRSAGKKPSTARILEASRIAASTPAQEQ